jgi:hypothetical protein
MMGRPCSKSLHSESPETYAKFTPIIGFTKQKENTNSQLGNIFHAYKDKNECTARICTATQ